MKNSNAPSRPSADNNDYMTDTVRFIDLFAGIGGMRTGLSQALTEAGYTPLYVADNGGLRRLTLREGLRLFGYSENMRLDVSEKEGFDLLGNTVVVPVVKAVCGRLLKAIKFN